MTERYEVTAAVPKVGSVKHVIRATDASEAIERMTRAHPGAVVISTKRVKPERR